jgi:tetratricopeptide (TPR) repeat protein
VTRASSAPGPDESWERLRWFGLVTGLALALRVGAIVPLVGTPLLDTVMGDALNYVARARLIAEGDWIGSEVFYQAPLYHYFIGTLYSLFGYDHLAVRGVQIVLGSVSCGLLTLAGWRWLSKPVGILAGVMLAIHAPAIFADLTLQKSVLDIFFVCLLLFLLGGVIDRPTLRRCIALGATLGVFGLSRENALVWAVVIAPWLWLLPAGTRNERLVRSACFAAGIALVLTPVALRNWTINGELHLTTSQFGHNFYIGNNEAADGTYRPLIARRADPRIEQQDAIDLAERATGRPLTPAEVSAFYTDKALDYIRAEPLDWAGLMARKLALAVNAVEWVDTKDQYSFGARSPVLWLADRVLHFGILAPLGLLGLWVTWPERRRLWLLHLLFLSYTGTLLLFYIFGRYRLPTTPIVMLFAAAGVTGMRRFAEATRREVVAIAAACVVGFMVFVNFPMSQKDYMRSVTEYNLANELYAAGDADAAIAHYEEAIRLYPGNALANHNLGSLLASRDEYDAAVAHFDRVIEIDDDFAMAHFNRALALEESGRLDEAARGYESALAIDPGNAAARDALQRVQIAESVQ